MKVLVRESGYTGYTCFLADLPVRRFTIFYFLSGVSEVDIWYCFLPSGSAVLILSRLKFSSRSARLFTVSGSLHCALQALAFWIPSRNVYFPMDARDAPLGNCHDRLAKVSGAAVNICRVRGREGVYCFCCSIVVHLPIRFSEVLQHLAGELGEGCISVWQAVRTFFKELIRP